MNCRRVVQGEVRQLAERPLQPEPEGGVVTDGLGPPAPAQADLDEPAMDVRVEGLHPRQALEVDGGVVEPVGLEGQPVSARSASPPRPRSRSRSSTAQSP